MKSQESFDLLIFVGYLMLPTADTEKFDVDNGQRYTTDCKRSGVAEEG